MRNQDVIRSFAWGKRAAAGNLQTDGRSLWSYNLKIAQLTPDGVVVGDFTSPGGGFPWVNLFHFVSIAQKSAKKQKPPHMWRLTPSATS